MCAVTFYVGTKYMLKINENAIGVMCIIAAKEKLLDAAITKVPIGMKHHFTFLIQDLNTAMQQKKDTLI